MNKKHLLSFLKGQPPRVLLDYLEAAFNQMDNNQRWAVFEKAMKKAEPLAVNAKTLLKEVEKFDRDSRKGAYYESFDMNSKNYSHIPEETEEWFEKLGDLLSDAARLSKQGEHAVAVKCFRILYILAELMESGEEIVFAHEYGMWMLSVDEEPLIATYLASLAAISTPEEYAASVLPLVRRDSYESFMHKTYNAALRAADKEQKARLKAVVDPRFIPSRRKRK